MSLLPIMIWLNIRSAPGQNQICPPFPRHAQNTVSGWGQYDRRCSATEKNLSSPSQLRFTAAPAELLDDAFLGQPLDLARCASEQFGPHVHIVLAIARRAAVYRAADIGRGLRHFHRYFVDRPGADLGAGHLGEPFEMTELRVVIDPVLGILANAGRDAGLLQFHHAVVAVFGAGPGLDCGIERILVLQTVLQRGKAAVVEPVAPFGNPRQRLPFRVGEAGDRDPAVLARAAISAVRRGGLIRRTVAVAAEHAPIGRPVEYRRASEKYAALALRGVDPLSLAGALAVIDRTEQSQRVTIGAHPVEIGIAPAHRHRRFGQTGHLGLSAERRGDRPDRAHAPIGAVRAHPGLLDVDDVGPDRLHHIVAEAQSLQDAGREPLGHDIADADHVLRDLEALRVAGGEPNAALAR